MLLKIVIYDSRMMISNDNVGIMKNGASILLGEYIIDVPPE